MQAPSKVYGPYLDSTKTRRIVILMYPDGTRKTTANARYLLEKHLGRALGPHEEADHIDENPLNDALENLQVLSIPSHQKKSAQARPVKTWTGKCPECGVEFSKALKVVTHNRKQGKSGPYCGKSCSGKHTRRMQIESGTGPRGGTVHAAISNIVPTG